MAQRIGQRTVRFDHPPGILGYASVVGTKEAAGPLRGTFDVVGEDSHFGQKTWELAESQMQKTALETAAQKAGVSLGGLDMILAGDLLNQCIGSAFASVQSNVPYLGLYGACSTMAEGLAVGACLIDGGCANRLAAAASSHFCSAERQYRFPLAYGGQRPPTAQWTATASGAVVLDGAAKDLCITHAVIGQMVDLGVKDANNMGAAMAPAAYHTLSMLFEDLDAHPGDFDCIVTGDLADVGASLLAGRHRHHASLFRLRLHAVWRRSGCPCRRVGLRLLGGRAVRQAAAPDAGRHSQASGLCRHRRADESDLHPTGTGHRRGVPRGRHRTEGLTKCTICKLLLLVV